MKGAAVKFNQARVHFRKTRFDTVRMLVKRPLYLSLAVSAAAGLGPLGPAAAVVISSIFEGLKAVINRIRKGKIEAKDEQILNQLTGALKLQTAPAIANELQKCTGRGEKLLAKEVLHYLEQTAPPKYQEVTRLLEQKKTYISRTFKCLKSNLNTASFKYASLILAADQGLKYWLPQELHTSTDPIPLSSISKHSLITALTFVAFNLAKGRPLTQTGLGLLFWSGLSNLVDKSRLLGQVINLKYFEAPDFLWFDYFNLADVSITAGIVLLFLGMMRDR